jgi:hypothetical protein
MNTIEQTTFRFGMAWVALCLCLAVHVTDEALTGFLEVYNPTVLSVRRHLPFLPLPTFSFRVWLSGLVIGVCTLLLLALFAFRGARWMIPLAYLFAVLMLLNALVHLGGSVYFGRVMPGAYSAPLLLAGSFSLLWSARRLGRAKC